MPPDSRCERTFVWLARGLPKEPWDPGKGGVSMKDFNALLRLVEKHPVRRVADVKHLNLSPAEAETAAG